MFPGSTERARSGRQVRDPDRMLDPWLRHLLRRQEGLLTLDQVRERGLSDRTVQRRLRSGEWERVAPRVYLMGGFPFTDAVRLRSAALWSPPGGAVSGQAAAWWHGMYRSAPAVVEVTVPRRAAPRPPEGVRVRRRDLGHRDLIGVRGVWLTDKPLTALETAVAVPDGSVFLDRALQRYVTFERVYAAYCRNLGARGLGAAGRLLVAAADRADSAAERLARRILRDAGITGWVPLLPFENYRIDIGFPRQRVAVEVDGWAWHMDVGRFRADRHKGNALTRAGWDLLRFTWHDLSGRPDYLITEVRAALERAAA